MAGSQFGVMLFPDMPKGIAEMARVVRPGGRVVMIAYGDPHAIDFIGFFVAAVRNRPPGFRRTAQTTRPRSRSSCRIPSGWPGTARRPGSPT